MTALYWIGATLAILGAYSVGFVLGCRDALAADAAEILAAMPGDWDDDAPVPIRRPRSYAVLWRAVQGRK